MQQALGAVAADADVVVMAAAVADFRPTMRAVGKLSRRTNAPTAVPLTANPDLLAELGRTRTGTRPLLVGFAAEVAASGDALVERARQKLADKRCDVVVANDVSEARPGLRQRSQRRHTGLLGRREWCRCRAASKESLADEIWAHLAPLVEAESEVHPAPPPRLRAT